MILPFLSILFLISFIFVLKKNHNNGEKKKKDEKGPMMTTGFKVNCQTCIDKIQTLVLEFEGEMNFSVDKQKDWVTVNGIRDDIKHLRKILDSPVEIVPFRKDREGEKKKDEKGSLTTTVFRFPVHCERCIDQIRKMVLNYKGVTNVSVDMEKDLVTVNGTMDVKALTERLGEILMRKDKKDKKTEGEKGPETMMAFKVPQFEGVTDMSADIQKDLVTIKSIRDKLPLTDYIYMIEKLKRRDEIVSWQVNEVGNGSDGSDDGDGDDDRSGSGGDKNKKKGNGGDGDSDGDDRDKGEGGGGCGKMKGFKMDCMGESGFDYRYGYHAGFENEYPVGQLHVAQMSNSDNLNDNEVGNSHRSGIKDNNNGDSDQWWKNERHKNELHESIIRVV